MEARSLFLVTLSVAFSLGLGTAAFVKPTVTLSTGEQNFLTELGLQNWTLVASVGSKMFFTYLPLNISYWGEAQFLCRAFDLVPGQINNDEERELVHKFLVENIPDDEERHFNSRQFWLNSVDFWTEGRFYSQFSLRPVTYLPWAADKQPDGRYNENCLSYCGDCEPGKPERNGLHDSWCHTEHTIRPLCEFHVGGDMLAKMGTPEGKMETETQIRLIKEMHLEMVRANQTAEARLR